MLTVITFKFMGQTKEDAMRMPGAFEAYRDAMEAAKAKGAFGPPDAVILRYLVQPGKWE